MIQKIGFPNIKTQKSVVSPPVKSKSKGFIAFLLIAGIGYMSYLVWDAYFRHAAYGIVNARIIEVSSPYSGAISSLHVKEGDRVKCGQIVACIENIDVENQYNSLRDSLVLASSELNAQVSRLQLEYAFRLDSNIGTLVHYYQLLGAVAQEQARMEQNRDIYRRAEETFKKHAIAAQEVNVLRFGLQGHQKTLHELVKGAEEAKARVEVLNKLYAKPAVIDAWQEQLAPYIVKIDNIRADLERIKNKVELGKIRSPVNGVIAKIYHYPGEQCDPNKYLMAIVEDESYYVTLYLSEEMTDSYYIGQDLRLHSPFGHINCRIERFGEKYENAPESIKRHYKASQNLLPVRLECQDLPLKYGATVKLPYFGN